MTMHDLKRIYGHWKRFPPLRVLVAISAKQYGFKLPIEESAQPSKYLTPEEAAALMRRTGGKLELMMGGG